MRWSKDEAAGPASPTWATGGLVRRAVATGVLVMACSTADAALGDVQAKARATTDPAGVTTSMPSYDRTEFTAVDGGSVRQFSGHDGTVFAVDFSGPTMPDLKAMLGTHYDSYVAAARSRRGNHHVVSVNTDEAVITIVKLPRGFAGHAHLPAAVPAGVDVRTLR